MSPNYRRVYAYNSNVFTYSRKQVWANEVGEQKLYKAIYLVSETERRNETFYCTGAQSKIRFQQDISHHVWNVTSKADVSY